MAVTFEPNFNFIQQDLKSFRSRLFTIDADDESSKQQLCDILDEYRVDNFEPFAEEYVITRYDITIVCKTSIFL